jgi:hypothetical protein
VGVCLIGCGLKISKIRQPRTDLGCSAMGKKNHSPRRLSLDNLKLYFCRGDNDRDRDSTHSVTDDVCVDPDGYNTDNILLGISSPLHGKFCHCCTAFWTSRILWHVFW